GVSEQLEQPQRMVDCGTLQTAAVGCAVSGTWPAFDPAVSVAGQRAVAVVHQQLRLSAEHGGGVVRVSAVSTSVVVARGSVAQPTIRLANASRTLAGHNMPSPVRIRVRSATHSGSARP